jgi:hypothetical protein
MLTGPKVGLAGGRTGPHLRPARVPAMQALPPQTAGALSIPAIDGSLSTPSQERLVYSTGPGRRRACLNLRTCTSPRSGTTR